MKVTAHFFTTTAWARTAKSALSVIAVAALLATGPKAYGGVLFVDGNDPDCSAAGDPYCEIQDAVDDAVEGDNIQVRAGTYGRVVIDTDNITIQGIGGGEVIIDAAGLIGGSGVTLNADGVMIRRLTVENAGPPLIIFDPFFMVLAIWIAAQTFAPDDMPQYRPSSRHSLSAICLASAFSIVISSSMTLPSRISSIRNLNFGPPNFSRAL